MRLSKLFFLTLFWVSLSVYTQNKQLLYDFAEIPQSLMVNPGVETDFKWYAGVPGLSGISFQAGSSGFSAYDLFATDGLNFNDKIRNRLLNGMTARDELSITSQLEMVNIGFRGKDPNVFYSIGIYNEVDVVVYWFEDYAALAIDGNADRLNHRFDVGDFKARGEIMNVFHFGVNKKIDRKLIIGARAKIYSSILDINSSRNSGFFVTRPGQNNVLSSTFKADMSMKTSGIQVLTEADKDGE